jgi:hypothetical protein
MDSSDSRSRSTYNDGQGFDYTTNARKCVLI